MSSWLLLGLFSFIDTLGRLSVYTVPSTSTSYTALLPHFLPPRPSLPHTLVMIVLDWTRPWTFVEELQNWLEWVETWAKGDGSRELEIVREENRERCEPCTFEAIVGIIIIYIQCSHTSNNILSPPPIHCLPIQPCPVPFCRWGPGHLRTILLAFP
jgi:hypothetical protein